MLYGILVTHRRPIALQNSLKVVGEQTVSLDHLVVVDNEPSPMNERACSPDRPGIPAIEYVACGDNIGPAGGFALGMRRVLEMADADDWVVLFDDDDPPYREDLLEVMLRFAMEMRVEDPRTGGVGMFGSRVSSVLRRPVRPDWSESRGGAIPVDSIGNGRAPLYLVDAIRRVGPYDSRLFFGLEELEFGLRLRSAGYTQYANADVWRDWVRSEGSPDLAPRPGLQRPAWRSYYAVRNLIWIQRLHRWLLPAMFTSLVVAFLKPLSNMAVDTRAALTHLELNLRAVRDGWTGRLGRRVEPEVPGNASR